VFEPVDGLADKNQVDRVRGQRRVFGRFASVFEVGGCSWSFVESGEDQTTIGINLPAGEDCS